MHCRITLCLPSEGSPVLLEETLIKLSLRLRQGRREQGQQDQDRPFGGVLSVPHMWIRGEKLDRA